MDAMGLANQGLSSDPVLKCHPHPVGDYFTEQGSTSVRKMHIKCMSIQANLWQMQELNPLADIAPTHKNLLHDKKQRKKHKPKKKQRTKKTKKNQKTKKNKKNKTMGEQF